MEETSAATSTTQQIVVEHCLRAWIIILFNSGAPIPLFETQPPAYRTHCIVFDSVVSESLFDVTETHSFIWVETDIPYRRDSVFIELVSVRSGMVVGVQP